MTLKRLAKKTDDYASTNLAEGTRRLYDVCFRNLEAVIGNKKLNLISIDDVEKFKTDRLKHVSRIRVNVELRTLRAAFRRAVLWGHLSKSPLALSPLLRIPPMEAAYLTEKEFLALYRAAGSKLMREIILFALLTGMRRGEIVNLEWSDVDFDNGLINIRNKMGFTVKGMKPRSIPMNGDTRTLLLRKRLDAGFVFTDGRGRKLTGYNLSRQFKRCARRGGLRPEIHFHSLRHTYSHWLRGDIVQLQRLLGHANISTTQIYSHRGIDELREVAENVKVLKLVANQ